MISALLHIILTKVKKSVYKSTCISDMKSRIIIECVAICTINRNLSLIETLYVNDTNKCVSEY